MKQRHHKIFSTFVVAISAAASSAASVAAPPKPITVSLSCFNAGGGETTRFDSEAISYEWGPKVAAAGEMVITRLFDENSLRLAESFLNNQIANCNVNISSGNLHFDLRGATLASYSAAGTSAKVPQNVETITFDASRIEFWFTTAP